MPSIARSCTICSVPNNLFACKYHHRLPVRQHTGARHCAVANTCANVFGNALVAPPKEVAAEHSRPRKIESRNEMANLKIDRRSRRTRQALSEALISLMGEKRYDKITVQDIIDRANVGRSTFYAHYQDKEDLLVSGVETVFNLFSQNARSSTRAPTGATMSATSTSGSHVLSSLEIFRHAQMHLHDYQALVWGRGLEVLFVKGQRALARRYEDQLRAHIADSQTLNVPLPVVADYLAGALLTLLRWWLDNDMPYPPERMDAIFLNLVLPGVSASLGERV